MIWLFVVMLATAAPVDKRPGSAVCLAAKAYVALYGYEAVREKAVSLGYKIRDLDRCVKPMKHKR